MEFDLNAFMETLSRTIAEYAPKVVGALLALVIGLWIIARITRAARNYFNKANYDEAVESFLLSIVNIGLKILLFLAVAQMFGVTTTSFVAIFSALALAVGLALQNNLGHFASGILLLVFRPFTIKDFVVAGGYSGTVQEIQLFHTILTTLDNRKIIIPNGIIMSGAIENLTANPIRKVPMTFGIGYGNDIDKAREVIQRVADECPHIDHDKAVDIVVTELGDNSVNIAVRPWCKTEDYWTVFAWMQENMKKAFDKEGLNIPYPQMDVHLFNNKSN